MSDRPLTLNEQLRVAVENNDLAEVKRLIAAGANCTGEETDAKITNIGLLRSATSSGHLELVKYLVEDEGTKIDYDHEDHWTPLFYAAANGHLEIVRYFIEEQGVDVNSTDEYGMTPLHAACLRGQFEVVEYLVEKQKLDIYAKRNGHLTPIHDAYYGGNLEIVKYFLEKKGVSPTLTLTQKASIGLHIAAEHGHVQVIDYLLKTHHVDVKIKDSDGKTVEDFVKHYQEETDDADGDERANAILKLIG